MLTRVVTVVTRVCLVAAVAVAFLILAREVRPTHPRPTVTVTAPAPTLSSTRPPSGDPSRVVVLPGLPDLPRNRPSSDAGRTPAPTRPSVTPTPTAAQPTRPTAGPTATQPAPTLTPTSAPLLCQVLPLPLLGC